MEGDRQEQLFLKANDVQEDFEISSSVISHLKEEIESNHKLESIFQLVENFLDRRHEISESITSAADKVNTLRIILNRVHEMRGSFNLVDVINSSRLTILNKEIFLKDRNCLLENEKNETLRMRHELDVTILAEKLLIESEYENCKQEIVVLEEDKVQLDKRKEHEKEIAESINASTRKLLDRSKNRLIDAQNQLQGKEVEVQLVTNDILTVENEVNALELICAKEENDSKEQLKVEKLMVEDVVNGNNELEILQKSLTTLEDDLNRAQKDLSFLKLHQETLKAQTNQNNVIEYAHSITTVVETLKLTLNIIEIEIAALKQKVQYVKSIV